MYVLGADVNLINGTSSVDIIEGGFYVNAQRDEPLLKGTGHHMTMMN